MPKSFGLFGTTLPCLCAFAGIAATQVGAMQYYLPPEGQQSVYQPSYEAQPSPWGAANEATGPQGHPWDPFGNSIETANSGVAGNGEGAQSHVGPFYPSNQPTMQYHARDPYSQPQGPLPNVDYSPGGAHHPVHGTDMREESSGTSIGTNTMTANPYRPSPMDNAAPYGQMQPRYNTPLEKSPNNAMPGGLSTKLRKMKAAEQPLPRIKGVKQMLGGAALYGLNLASFPFALLLTGLGAARYFASKQKREEQLRRLRMERWEDQ